MIHVYTGNGKGKTTAALGLAVRSAGAGINVYIAQFAKGQGSSELNALKKIKNIKVEQFGRCCFIRGKPDKGDVEQAALGLNRVKEIIREKKYGLIILDEINVALKLNLVSLREVQNILKKISKKIEIVLTGRDAHPLMIKRADLVSEVKEIKHYYNRKLKARKGIEY